MQQLDYPTDKTISEQVHSVINSFAPVVERYSMDEYFIELTHMREASRKELYAFAKRLQDEIYKVTGLVGAIGIGRSKTYTKLASGLNKPTGISLILNEGGERTHIYPRTQNVLRRVGRRRA